MAVDLMFGSNSLDISKTCWHSIIGLRKRLDEFFYVYLKDRQDLLHTDYR